MNDLFSVIVLGFLLVCAVATALTRNLLASVIIFMAYSLMMSVVWALLMAPDLAVTEAAVGAGISSVLLFLTLKKIRDIREAAKHEKTE